MQYVVLLILAVILQVGSSILYKYSSLNSGKQALSIMLLVAGLLLGAVNAALYTKSLKGISLNTAYPVFSAGSLVLVVIVSIFLFGETVSIYKMLGILVLVGGVVLVSI